ncbi:MAG TPA: hypothetical protein PKD90_11015, partial [Phnomibacter sp.]|nr:hypothetical protein [Phnomibacter sp.]
GHFIVLRANNQTRGGSPRVLKLIGAHLPLLAQAGPATRITLQLTHLQQALDTLQRQHSQFIGMAASIKYHLRK